MTKFRELNIKHGYLTATPADFQRTVEKALSEMSEEVAATIKETATDIAKDISSELKTEWLRSNRKHKHIADSFDIEEVKENKLPATLIGARHKQSKVIRFHELGYRVDKRNLKLGNLDLRDARKKLTKEQKESAGAKFKPANPIVRNIFDRHMPEELITKVNAIIDKHSKK